MAELVIHGVIDGQQVSKCDKAAQAFCEQFYATGAEGVKSHVGRLADNRVAYSYLIFDKKDAPFISYGGRRGSYFGMTLFFQNQQVMNPDALFEMMQKTYNQYVKGRIISESATGARKWICSTLNDPNDTVASYVGQGFQKVLEQNKGLLKFQTVTPLRRQGREY